MDKAEVISISGDDGIDRIYPPKGFRERIISIMHRGGKHYAIVNATCNQHYRWPQMRSDKKTHTFQTARLASKTARQRPKLSTPA